INGSFWIGAAIGAVAAIVLLDPNVLAPDLGWRLAYFIGAALGLIVFVMRMWIPESPRWLMIHGRPDEAHAIVDDIERASTRHSDHPADEVFPKVRLKMRSHTPLGEVAHTLFTRYRQRSLVGLVLMASQAFFYNAIFFTFALVLTDFFGIPSNHVGWYILPFAAGNFLGPLLLGRLFDTLGRRTMIAFTYGVSGVLLALSGYLFSIGALSAQTQTIAWMVIFFFASPAASAAYLTVSETFPLEVRALAIALFYAVGTGIGGVVGPALFGALSDTAVLLDIDGTLLDLAPTPREVWVPPGLAKTLHRLHQRTNGALALVSGRSLNDIDLIFAPDQFPAVGGHGAEMRLEADSEAVAAHAPPMDKGLKRRVAAIARLSPGILLEDEGYSLAPQYGLAPQAEYALSSAVSLVRADLPNAPIEVLP